MKLQNTKLGFTLIELLVVITIIGILATGAVGIYTSQIQKARDTTRITSMSALKGALEQAFSDMSMYPGNAATQLLAKDNCTSDGLVDNTSVYCTVSLGFLTSLPEDPKSGQSGNGSPLVYTYNFGNVNGVVNQAYEISTGVESDGLKTSKASNTADGGSDDNRIEFGTLEDSTGPIKTCIDGTASCTDSVSATNSTTSCVSLNGVVVIAGDCD